VQAVSAAAAADNFVTPTATALLPLLGGWLLLHTHNLLLLLLLLLLLQLTQLLS
jgi:hypothetical protein